MYLQIMLLKPSSFNRHFIIIINRVRENKAEIRYKFVKLTWIPKSNANAATVLDLFFLKDALRGLSEHDDLYPVA